MIFNKILSCLLLGLLLLMAGTVCAQEHKAATAAPKETAKPATQVVTTTITQATTITTPVITTAATSETLIGGFKHVVDDIAKENGGINGTQLTEQVSGSKEYAPTGSLRLLHYYGVYAGIFMAFVLFALFIRLFCHKLSQKYVAQPGRATTYNLLAFYWPLFFVVMGLHVCLWSAFPRFFTDTSGEIHTTINKVSTLIDLLLLGLAILRPLDIWGFDYYCVEKNHWRLPRLIRDVIRAPLYAFAVIFAYTYSFGGSLSGLFATSAVLSFILGFALQDTLSNLFAGLAIHIEGSFGIGDWVEVGTREGEVSSVTWRAIKIRTGNDDYLIIPNSAVAKGEMVNHSQPTPLSGQSLELNIPVSVSPHKLERILMEITTQVEEIEKKPTPSVCLKNFGDTSVTYALFYYIRNFGNKGLVRHKLNQAIWYHFKREGIAISAPAAPTYVLQTQSPTEAEPLPAKTTRLSKIDFLSSLDQHELEKLAKAMTPHLYAQGEIILRQGATNDLFFLLERGKVVVEQETLGKEPVYLAELLSGAFFGEHSLLTGDMTTATVRAAAQSTEVSILKKDAFEELLGYHPEVAEIFSRVLTERTAHREQVRGDGLAEENKQSANMTATAEVETEARSLLSRIKNLFRLS